MRAYTQAWDVHKRGHGVNRSALDDLARRSKLGLTWALRARAPEEEQFINTHCREGNAQAARDRHERVELSRSARACGLNDIIVALDVA